ncbi:MAG: PQQ-binding-like beta-propeller repeat protein [Polyangiales bacterium]
MKIEQMRLGAIAAFFAVASMAVWGTACGSQFRVLGAQAKGEPSPRLLWTHDFNADAASLLAAATDGTLFLAYQRDVIAMAPSGAVRWTSRGIGEARRAVPLADGGLVVLATRDPRAETRSIVFLDKRGQNRLVRPVPIDSEMLVDPSGTIVVRAANRVGAMDAITGELLWTAEMRTQFASSSTASLGKHLGPLELDTGGFAYVTRPETTKDILTIHRVGVKGASLGRWPVPGAESLPHLAVTPDGSLYAFAFWPETDVTGTGKEVLFAFRADGSERWSREIPIGYETTHFAVGPNRFTYVTHGTKIEATGPDGSPKWSLDMCVDGGEDECDSLGGIAVGPTGVLYVGHGRLDAVSPDGRVLWSYRGLRGTATNVVYAGGRIYVVDVDSSGARSSTLHALGGDGGPRSGALWAEAYRPGRGGYFAPEPRAGAEATKHNGKPASAEADLCAWGFAAACIEYASELANSPETAAEGLVLLGPLCSDQVEGACEAMENVVRKIDAVSPSRASDLLAVRCANGQPDACATACVRGEPASCYVACLGGEGGACTRLGHALRVGKGVVANSSFAIGAFQLGCVQGSGEGCSAVSQAALDEELGGSAAGAGTPSGQGFETFVLEQSAALKQAIDLEGRRAAAKKKCDPADTCCIAALRLGPACAVLGCARVPGC